MSTSSSSSNHRRMSNQFRSHTLTLHPKATPNTRILVEVHLRRLLNRNNLTGSEEILSFLKALLFYALTIANDNPAFEHNVFISPNENSTFTTLVELSHSLSTPSQVVEKCGNIIIGWLNSRRFLSAEAKQICEQRIRAVTLDIQSELPSTLESAVAPSPSFVVQYNPTPQTAEGAQYFTDENGDQHGPFPSAGIAVWESQNYNGGPCRASSACITCLLGDLGQALEWDLGTTDESANDLSPYPGARNDNSRNRNEDAGDDHQHDV